MINLAGLRYRNIFEDRGGPVSRLETFDFSIEGIRMFRSNVYLRPELYPSRAKRAVYNQAAGSGVHASPMVARFMAISESMERWAYHATVRSSERATYAFDIDPMSNGMAAFPGLWPAQARRKAYLEAVERFCMIAWWEGMLPTIIRPTAWKDVTAAVIWSAPGEVVVVLHKQTEDGQHAYGHAAGEDFSSACRSALIELSGHECVIRNYRLAKACSVVEAPSCMLEQRSVFFASEDGHEVFLRRIHSRPDKALPARHLAFDGRIRGPWDKYADVWRVVFHPVTDRYMDPDETYFLW